MQVALLGLSERQQALNDRKTNKHDGRYLVNGNLSNQTSKLVSIILYWFASMKGERLLCESLSKIKLHIMINNKYYDMLPLQIMICELYYLGESSSIRTYEKVYMRLLG